MIYEFHSQVDYGEWCRTYGKTLDFVTITGPFDDLPVVVRVRGDLRNTAEVFR